MRILAVDDETLALELIVFALKAEGHTVVSAKDGIEGLQRFQEHEFDLVMTDHFMPNMDGLALAKAIKSQKPAQRILLMSGGGGGDIDSVFDYVLNKPIRIKALSDLIQQVGRADSVSGT